LNYGFLPEIETDPIRAALWSAAAACIQHTTGEWWCSSVVACGETFSVIESYLYGDEAAEDMDPDTAAFLLLLIREADATSRDLLH
jgi:hypothetical protein